jgi:peptidoglycan hydrolase-like protein with peptidoglycan-binding domain
MAVITQTIQPGEKSAEVTEIQKAFISLGAIIAPGELFTATTPGTYGPTTQAAVASLLRRFGFEPPLDPEGEVIPPPFNASVGRLLNIAVGAELGSTAALRKAVRESFAVINTAPAATPAEKVWLARYAVIADFTTARKIAAQVPNEPVIKEKVGPIVNLTTLQPPAPELLNPENYYTVLYDYVSRSTIKSLLQGA